MSEPAHHEMHEETAHAATVETAHHDTHEVSEQEAAVTLMTALIEFMKNPAAAVDVHGETVPVSAHDTAHDASHAEVHPHGEVKHDESVVQAPANDHGPDEHAHAA